jgi:hypothetical protein
VRGENMCMKVNKHSFCSPSLEVELTLMQVSSDAQKRPTLN